MSVADPGEVLVDPAWIAAHLDDPQVRLVEVDVSPAAYVEGHIPGATLWNAYGDLRDGEYLPVDDAELERLLTEAGVCEGTTLVFYGYGASLGFWLMKARGHADVRMLDGPREQWGDAGGTWSSEVATGGEASAQRYRIKPAAAALEASREAVEVAIDDREVILLDVRSELEFEGERFWPSGASADVGRAGHIPGAIHLPIEALREQSGALRGAEELRRAFEGKGVTSDKAVIVYCTIGNRASHAWFGLTQLLGYPDVRVYYASWVEWGKRADTPIEAS